MVDSWARFFKQFIEIPSNYVLKVPIKIHGNSSKLKPLFYPFFNIPRELIHHNVIRYYAKLFWFHCKSTVVFCGRNLNGNLAHIFFIYVQIKFSLFISCNPTNIMGYFIKLQFYSLYFILLLQFEEKHKCIAKFLKRIAKRLLQKTQL